jgi:hypothetical protein
MAWPIRCASCKSRDILHGLDEISCLVCGRLTDQHGVAVPLDEQFHSDDAYTDLLLAELAEHRAAKEKGE